jgi:RNA polymerase sigma-70 factor (ECF subfamily)
VCGLQTGEIARAFLQAEATVARRLVRAKAKVRDAVIPFRVPPAHLLPERVPYVLACAYLVFSEGYAATAGDELVRHELCDEGIRLARLVVELMPDEAEARGLLALMLVQDSRRAARLSADGELVASPGRRGGRARRFPGRCQGAGARRPFDWRAVAAARWPASAHRGGGRAARSRR